MTLGIEVTKPVLDSKMAQAVIAMRAALEKVETIQAWLANHPVVDGVDPLVEEPFDYNVDEAYAIRLYFGSVDSIRTNNVNISDIGRKMTGLE
jgi:hypothetical protein